MSAGPIGVICDPGHEVFAAVADGLRDRGHAVEFFEPGRDLAPATIDGLSALVNKKMRIASLRALRYADRTGVPTWNGYVPTAVLGARLSAHCVLEAAGFRVPPVSFEPPDGDYVAKALFSWDAPPTLGGEGDFYQPLLRTDPVDHKYYAVHDGRRVRVRVLRVSSKLYGGKEHLGTADVDPALVAGIERLVDRTGARAVGVDFVRSAGEFYAVDVNPAPSFRRAGLEGALVDSIDATTSRG